MDSEVHDRQLVGLSADPSLLTHPATELPSGVGRPPETPPSTSHDRIVNTGAALTGVTLIGGIVLSVFAAIDLIGDAGGDLALAGLLVGILLVATHWGWVHVAEATAEGLDRRHHLVEESDTRAWLAAIAPYTRHEVSTSAGSDGTITLERVRFRPVRSSASTFTFVREIEASEVVSGDEPGENIAEQAELLRRRAAGDTERALAQYETEVRAREHDALVAGDEDEHARLREAESRALSEQLNARLRDPPLSE